MTKRDGVHHGVGGKRLQDKPQIAPLLHPHGNGATRYRPEHATDGGESAQQMPLPPEAPGTGLTFVRLLYLQVKRHLEIDEIG
jgi:hypothetical protein